MSRAEHLKWAKERALCEDSGILMWASFVNDMSKHSELIDHIALHLIITIDIDNATDVKNFIEGFN